MITVRAGSSAIGVCWLLLLAGCSREQQDWRSAETADTIDSYGQFIQRHPESELATQARARIAQLGEDRDWQHAGSADTVDAYREFIAQHPNGKWAQEAHIRIENFSLGEQAGTDAGTKATSATGSAAAAGGLTAGSPNASGPNVGGGRDAAPAARDGAGTGNVAHSYALAEPGEAATPMSKAIKPSAAPGSPATGMPSGSAGSGIDASTTSASTTGASRTGASPAPRTATASTLLAPADTATSALRPGPPIPPSNLTPAASVSKPIPKGSFGIQLGAFSSEASATAQWHILTATYASELQGLQEHVATAETASGRIYRLQAVVGQEGRARSICDLLRRRGQACVAVLPH